MMGDGRFRFRRALWLALLVLAQASASQGAKRAGTNRLCPGAAFRIGDKTIRSFDELSKFFSYYSLIPRIDAREMVAVSVEVGRGGCGVFLANTTLYMRASTKDLRLLKDAFQYGVMRGVLDASYNRTAPKTILLLGGHTGMGALYLALRYPKAQLVVVEPDLPNFALLRLNTAQLPQVHLEYGAAWDRAATVRFGRDGHGRSLWQRFVVDVVELTTSRIGELVPALYVGDLLAKYGWSNVDLVVADLEGAESVVIADPSAREWLPKAKCIAARPYDGQSAPLHRMFSSLRGPATWAKRAARSGYAMWCRSDAVLD